MAHLRVAPSDTRVRTVVRSDSDETNVDFVVPDLEFHANSVKTFDYVPNFFDLENLADAIANDRDGCAEMDRHLNVPGTLTLRGPHESSDHTGKLFSNLESVLFWGERFDYYVEPSRGTLYRLEKNGRTHCNALVIKPYNYPNCSQQEKEKFAEYKTWLSRMAITVGIDVKISEVTWQSLPEGNIYFSHYGWRMHDLPNCVGKGIELNPHVAAAVNVSMLRYDDEDDYYRIHYSRNGAEQVMKYHHVPVHYRLHGGDVMRYAHRQATLANNLFNVVSTTPTDIHQMVNVTHVQRMVYCADRVIVPQIVEQRDEVLAGKSYTVAYARVDGQRVAVDILSPAYEVSCRQMILARHFPEPHYDTGPYSVLSTLAATYLNYSLSQMPDLPTFASRDLVFPSAWYYNGNAYVLRAYPQAARYEVAPTGLFYRKGKWYAPSREGGDWFYPDGSKNFARVPSSKFYDNALIVHEMYENSHVYLEAGKSTKMWYRDREGDEKLIVPRPSTYLVEQSVTIRLSKTLDIKTGEMVVMKPFMMTAPTLETRTSDVVSYRFATSTDANTFYCANVGRYKNCIWRGDLQRPISFVGPCTGKEMLVDPIEQFDDDHTRRLKLMDCMVANSQIDPVGNFVGDDSGDVNYTVYDFDEGLCLSDSSPGTECEPI